MEEEDNSPVEQVRVAVSTKDDPSLPVWTFRMWVLGLLSCVLLSFFNTFFSYQTEAIIITMISVQVATLPLGRAMERILPTRKFRVGSWEFSLNPGPFNVKEHVLISMFANAGSAFGNGTAYAVGIVNIITVFYHRKISFLASWILVITTQVLGYGWAGILRKYVVEPAHMWWPASIFQVSLFNALHEKQDRKKDKTLSRSKFFAISLICSFAWYIVPGYFLSSLSSLALLCVAFPKSVVAHQLGSGLSGLGLGAFSFDWSVVSAFNGNPLITPFFAIANIAVGFVLMIYIVLPVAYWGMNVYNAKNFAIISQHTFNAKGQRYDVSAIVNDKFELDSGAYAKQGPLYLSVFFAVSYGLGFAAVVATLSHVIMFNGREIYRRFRANDGKEDIHTRLMRKYKDVPDWWFHVVLAVSFILALGLCIFMKDQIQMPWWALIMASVLALVFTLPVSIITATTNQTPGLNIITEYLIGLIMPGHPIANVCFKTYGYMSMTQAVSFLNDLKLGHYMKVPPRSMFIVQLVGTIVAGTTNLIVAWWLLHSVPNICQTDLLPASSPWTCPNDSTFYSASVIWGLLGPRRIFGPLGSYGALNWFFLGGALGPVFIWLLHRTFPNERWISLINLPVILGAVQNIPPAGTINFTSWIVVGFIFNFLVLRYKKQWWVKYNYVLAAALDAGLAFMMVLLPLALTLRTDGITWWGSQGEHCDLATCPTAKGIVVDGCPVY